MNDRFDAFFEKLMKYEGGYVNDPKDPGGETKFGISKRAYPVLDIKNLTKSQARLIYLTDYYQPLHIGEFKDEKTAWQVFDFGVNAGVVRSAKTLQEIVKTRADGIIGKQTIEKSNLFAGLYPLWIYFKSERMMYYMDLTERNPKKIKFLKGWMIRTLEL